MSRLQLKVVSLKVERKKRWPWANVRCASSADFATAATAEVVRGFQLDYC
jgi:hypothetical protein